MTRDVETADRVSCDRSPHRMRIAAAPRWILFGLVPLAVLALGLHVREVLRTGLVQPPIYAAPAPSPSDYPTVGGTTVEVQGEHELEPGDRLLQVGTRDLRGRGYLGFMGLVFEEADAQHRVPLVYERDGERRETVLELEPFAIPWLRIPFLSMMLVIVVLLLVRRPEDPYIRLGVVTFCAVTIGESIFDGGSYAQAVAGKLVFILGGAIWWPLVIRFVSVFPGDDPDREPVPGTPAVMVAAGACFVLPKLLYLTGGPTPPEWTPAIVYAGDGITVGFIALIFAVSYRRAAEDTRRRMKWVVYAAWAAGLPMFLALMLPVIAPGVSWFGDALAIAGISAAIIPIGVVIGVLGYDLFDIDRLISATASYSLLLFGLLAALVAGVPWLASGMAAPLGVEPGTARLALSIALAALAVPLNQWLQPRIDGWFFPERHRVEEGVKALLAEQALEGHAGPLAELVARRLEEIFRPEFALAFVAAGEGYVSTLALPEGRAPEAAQVPGSLALVSALAQGAGPLAIGDRRLATSDELRPKPGSVFADPTRAALLLPIREFDALPAFVALGPKRSGDHYPATEIALFSVTADAAKRQLERVREAEALARERVRSVELDRKRREAEAAHLTRSRHLAAASHDLRQPLHALRLFAEALVEEAESPRSLDLARRVRGSAEALHEMFDALIDLSRLEQGTLVPDVVAFPLRPLLERLRAEAELPAEAKGLALEVEAPDVEVRSDPVLLARIVQNLLSNALRYTDSGSVSLRVSVHGERVLLRVADTGSGIPESKRQEVFEEFVRLEPEKSQRGLGLGLSIVKRLSELLGHPLELESTPGEGTTFTLAFPVAHGSEAVAPRALAPDFAGRELLLVEDDLDVLVAMRALLESWGAHVTLATDGAEALEALDGGARPDAIIADYRLRDGETGPQVVASIRARLGSSLPALVITGSTSGEVADDLRRHGFVRLQKPVSPARLRAALGQLLRESSTA